MAIETRVRLITRGDDAASNETANRAIQEAARDGILKNVSVMAPCDALDHAAELLADMTDVCFGIHGTLNAEWDRVTWGPVLHPSAVPSLVDDRGCFPQRVEDLRAQSATLDHTMAELQAQLDRGRKAGFTFTYADQHMNFGRAIDGFDEAFGRWCEREGLIDHRPFNGRLPNVGDAAGDAVDGLIAKLSAAGPGTYLLVGHPAYDTEEMRRIGTKNHPGEQEAVNRDWQRRWFLDERVLSYCEENGVKAIRYDEA